VTRFFMTVEEAVQLVVQAGAIGHDGEVLVLDMGEPVRIADVARQLAASRAHEVPIVFTGLRPGEKLHEDLFCRAEMAMPTEHPLIRQVGVPPLDPSFVENIEPNGSGEEMLDILRLLAGQIDASLESTIDLTAEGEPAITRIVL
jgi:FlaA1/EpsC-like NDP-sugar epimerase